MHKSLGSICGFPPADHAVASVINDADLVIDTTAKSGGSRNFWIAVSSPSSHEPGESETHRNPGAAPIEHPFALI